MGIRKTFRRSRIRASKINRFRKLRRFGRKRFLRKRRVIRHRKIMNNDGYGHRFRVIRNSFNYVTTPSDQLTPATAANVNGFKNTRRFDLRLFNQNTADNRTNADGKYNVPCAWADFSAYEGFQIVKTMYKITYVSCAWIGSYTLPQITGKAYLNVEPSSLSTGILKTPIAGTNNAYVAGDIIGLSLIHI